MNELVQLRGLVETVLRRQDEIIRALRPKNRPPLTRHEFAKAIGRSYKTVCRWVDGGKIREVDGRIPASESDRFVS